MKTKLYLFAILALFAAVAVGTINFTPAAQAQAQAKRPATASVYVISTNGVLTPGGAYTQATGNFAKFVEGPPVPTPTPFATPTPVGSPTPTPSPTPTCVPSPGSPGGTLYFGAYVLSNGESGTFIVNVTNGTDEASGTAAPDDFPENAIVASQGTAAVTLQINAAAGTGNGTIAFSDNGNAVTGTVVITTKVPLPATPPVTCGNDVPTPTPTPAASPTPVATPTPTPETTEVSGRVTTPTGLGLRDAIVTLSDGTGAKTSVTTSSFGGYRFEGVRVNEAYVVSVASKRYRFGPQMIVVVGPTTDLNLRGLE